MLRRLLLAAALLAKAGMLMPGSADANMLQAASAAAPAGPTSNAAPVLSGTAAYPSTLTCTGLSTDWTPPTTSGTTVQFQFFSNGVSQGSPSGAFPSAPYTVQNTDQGKTITCKELGTNGGTTTSAASNGIAIPLPAGSCSQSIAFFGRAGTFDLTHHNAYDSLICGLVTDGVWPLLDLLYILATDTEANAQLNLVASTNTLTKVGSPTFTADRGYAGTNASTSIYLNSGLNLTAATNYKFSNAHSSEWSLAGAQAPSSAGATMGAYDGTNWMAITPYHSNGGANMPINDTSSNPSHITPSLGATGHYIANRSGTGSTIQGYWNGASQTFSSGVQSSAVPNANVCILVYCTASGAANGTSNQVATISVGGSLTAAQVSSGTTGLYQRLCTYLTAVGARSGAC